MNIEVVIAGLCIARDCVKVLTPLPRGGWVITYVGVNGTRHVAVDARGYTASTPNKTVAAAAFEAGERSARMDAREAQEELEEAERQRRGQ